MTGIKHDKGKNRLDLVDTELVEGVGKVLTFGAKKYSENSWQEVENGKDRYYAALLRHLFAYKNGERLDKESNLSHLYHVATNVMFLIFLNKKE